MTQYWEWDGEKERSPQGQENESRHVAAWIGGTVNRLNVPELCNDGGYQDSMCMTFDEMHNSGDIEHEENTQ